MGYITGPFQYIWANLYPIAAGAAFWHFCGDWVLRQIKRPFGK